ncbi:MAG: hypothetical protein KAW42_07365 [Candidatus Atribacteria bacterium]|nr:hypothetical protein [Candidatus Atribacteria bacterium]
MRIMKVKRAIILLLAIGVMTLVSGCVRYPDGHNGNGETNYQLEITVEVYGEINTADEGIYYIVLDADENPETGPGSDILPWEVSYYYIKLEDGLFYFAKPEGGFEYYTGEILDGDDDGNKESFQVTIALSDLGKPESVDINVITTDTESSITYDHLATYFTVYTENIGFQNPDPDSLGDSGDGGVDFDIVKITAEIISP